MRDRTAIMVDRATRDVLAKEAARYGLSIAAVIRILAHKVKAGKVDLI